MLSKKSKNKEMSLYKILYYTSIAMIPNFFLLNVYNQNQPNIQFNHVVFLAIILAIASLLGGMLLQFVTRSYEGSLLTLFLFWTIFWFFEFIREKLPINSAEIILAIIAVVLTCLTVLLKYLSDKLQKGRIIFRVISGVILLLFLFNAIPAIIPALDERSYFNAENNWQIRRHFEVDATLPNPDIYWLHMDGMINFEDAEYYFDIQTNESREGLLELGFVINNNAEFIAGGTRLGVPALLSPDFYDSLLHDVFKEGRHLMKRERDTMQSNIMEYNDISLADDVAPYHELFHAFIQAGYTTTTIARISPTIFTPINHFYNLGDEYPFFTVNQSLGRHFLVESLDLIELLVMMTPIPGRFANIVSGASDSEWQAIPSHLDEVDRLTSTTLNLAHERHLYQALIDHLETSPTKSIAYITLNFTHVTAWGLQVDEEIDRSRIDLYPLAHKYALHVMFNMIDMILYRNSDAVIVLQSDHGIHCQYSQEALLEAGFTEEEMFRLFDSTISAVRIPERYGGLDEPLAPLNITRYLVNRFVGENYQLLDQ